MKIFVVPYNENLHYKTFKQYLTCCSQEKQAKIKRFKKTEDAHRALFGDLLIRSVICTTQGIENSKIEFGENHYGKPFLKGHDSFCFNISHSGRWIVCAVDNQTIGVDVEAIKPIDFSIAENFFSSDECTDLMSKDENKRLDFFFELWTLKESYIKSVGKGLSLPLNSFSMRIQNNNIKLETENQYGEFSLKLYNIDDRYKLALCSKSRLHPQNVIKKSIYQVYEDIE